MKIRMSLIAKGINIEKVCTTKRQVLNFERDMPAKHNLLFSKTPYAIGKMDLEAI